MRRVDIYVFTDITGPRPRTGCYMYLLEVLTAKGPATFHRLVRVEEKESENRIQLKAVIEALERLTESCEVMIHTQSRYLAAGVGTWAKEWEARGWTTKKGGPVANREEWQSLMELLKLHLVSIEAGPHSYSSWMELEIKREEEKDKDVRKVRGI